MLGRTCDIAITVAPTARCSLHHMQTQSVSLQILTGRFEIIIEMYSVSCILLPAFSSFDDGSTSTFSSTCSAETPDSLKELSSHHLARASSRVVSIQLFTYRSLTHPFLCSASQSPPSPGSTPSQFRSTSFKNFPPHLNTSISSIYVEAANFSW